ncbi:sigma-70 family RNA polymerase sigma factor [Phenylobacterium sp.]|jgi:RNA polymerase sigma-70 factor, ECF subfamily|uniref:sigma-70 family RNA polymerase sigma factor n=1 Tax=Phenylobacterium sp. TaxID=1871053 RepID=UPI001201D645|nr:sigma-70 family RNA polymerase sigma factor [Phenylobacterium sp.]THD56014.1 MAG: sigma-70 family RNA polymerase sigma factor [Phenylobacterium sp.]
MSSGHSPEAAEIDPEALIARIVQSQDRSAFEALFIAFAPRIKTYLMLRGASPDRSEELAQETLLLVWRKAASFDPERASLGAWMFAIARNMRIDALRREKSARNYALSVHEPGVEETTPHTASEAAQTQARLREAMAELPPEQMEIVQLSFYEDKPQAEIAAQLGLPLGTVKSRLRLAVAKLRGRVGALS